MSHELIGANRPTFSQALANLRLSPMERHSAKEGKAGPPLEPENEKSQ